MRTLYNMTHRVLVDVRNPGNLVLLAMLGCVCLGAISCKKGSTARYDGGAVRPVAEAIAEADKFYAERTDLVKVRQGIVSLRQAQADDSGNYEIAWRLAKFNYYLGAHTPNSTEQDKAFHEGIDAGKLAVKLQDGKPEGHFWLGANYGGTAQMNTLSGLSQINDIKEQMEAVLKINEGFQTGSAYMVLGQVYLQAPRLLGGDVEQAISYFEKGVKVGPDNALLRLRLAQGYVAAHRNPDAQKQIDALMSMKPVPGYEPEYNEAVTEARKLQEKMK